MYSLNNLKLKNELIEKAIAELVNPTHFTTTTTQYLEVMDLEVENGKPKVERVDLDSIEETNVVYFVIKDEPFFLSVYFSKDDNEITNVGSEMGSEVYFTATSESMSYDQLSKLTNLQGLKGWNKGDTRKYGNGKYTFSRIIFDPFECQAYNLEAKLLLLLNEMEKDKEGVIRLTKLVDAGIVLHLQHFVNGNQGVGFDSETIKRLSNLNIGVEIDQYVSGNELKD